jgi:hypothetical protein
MLRVKRNTVDRTYLLALRFIIVTHALGAFVRVDDIYFFAR